MRRIGNGALVILLGAIGVLAAAPAQSPPDLGSAGRVFRDCADCPEMVVVPPGTFRMGAESNDEEGRSSERPVHEVQIEAFALGRTEVTRRQFAAFVAATRRGAEDGCISVGQSEGESDNEASWRRLNRFRQTDDHPVVCVNWFDAGEYVAWLTGKTGIVYRLPSEAEWEYAARAGTTTARYWQTGPGDQCGAANGADAAAKARFNDWLTVPCNDGVVYTAPAGAYDPNAFGLFDMLGNVWEYTDDCWHSDYGGSLNDGTVWTSGGDCAERVIRGGGWKDQSSWLRSAARYQPVVKVDDPGISGST